MRRALYIYVLKSSTDYKKYLLYKFKSKYYLDYCSISIFYKRMIALTLLIEADFNEYLKKARANGA